jgi:hypothetical protein
VTLLGISSHGLQDQLTGIEPHMQRATIGDAGRWSRRFLNRNSPSNAFPDKPSPRNEGCHPHSISAGSSRPREAQAEVGGHSGGFRAAKVPRWRSSLHQRSKDGERTRSKVYQMDDMAEWTHVASLFMRHENICKPQRTIMTPWLYGDKLGYMNESITDIVITTCNYPYK